MGRRFLRAIARKFEVFLCIPDYCKAMARQWSNLILGETVLAVVFLVWWALVNPSNPPLIATFVIAGFVASYLIWYGEHVRLLPGLRVARVLVQPTPTTLSTENRVYIHIIPECLS